MAQPKKLIEVAMPIKEISAESVRDKSIRHGHISTLHLWWARRPLPVCRAVVFASLVPDPLDENCPQAFIDAVEILLGSETKPLVEDGFLVNSYKPYDDIPYTAAADRMKDNGRHRLLMFIGKFSDVYAKKGEKTPAKDMLSDFSLIKWDNKNNSQIINKARKFIWVAFNSKSNDAISAEALLLDFEEKYSAIKKAESNLYKVINRHILTDEVQKLTMDHQLAVDAFLEKMPSVFDPFAGGGAIPLEAARLGCNSYGNDINPVAHIIQRGSLEFPQKYGKPILYSKKEFIDVYGTNEFNQIDNEQKVIQNGEVTAVAIANRLSFDVGYYANKLLVETEKEIGYLYPADSKGNKPIAYYWARVAICSNPSCKAQVPLLRQFYLVNTPSKQVFLNPIINGTQIDFEIKNGICTVSGWVERANLKCPCCSSITEVKKLKEQFFNKKTTERLLAVIEAGREGKNYRLPTSNEMQALENIPFTERPTELLPKKDSQNLKIPFWGFHTWGEMFTDRQLFAIKSIINCIGKIEISINESNPTDPEYIKAVVTYLSFLVSKSADYNSSFCTWHPGREVIGHVFTKQAVPMVFDFPETYPFSHSSGGMFNMIDWICRYIVGESKNEFYSKLNNASSGDKEQFKEKYITAVVTDPPYYDAIAYADLSDFFYVWLKRSLSNLYPLNFATPQTPKSDECTAIKHHHNDNKLDAKIHFEKKLTQIFDAIEHQTSDIVSIMFAHQSTEAWTTLCNSILGARMNITGSWCMDTEMANRSLGLAGAALESSVTVSCIPSQRGGLGEFKKVKKAIEHTVAKEVDQLYGLGFRGADLLTACFGQAVSEFGKYEKVEKADGSEVTVAELLEMARESAFNALLRGFEGDDFTKFYIAWLQLNGFAETDFNDAVNFTRVGLSIDVQDLFKEHILIKNGNKQHLGSLQERIKLNSKIGEGRSNILIDNAHKLMHLYDSPNRNNLLKFIDTNAGDSESLVWRVVTSLAELLPKDFEDHKLAVGLLTNKDQLIRESKTAVTPKTEQARLTFE